MIALFVVSVVLLGLGLDYYVYRNWRRFAQNRWPWTLPAYLAAMFVVAAGVPAAFAAAQAWLAHPRPVQQITAAVWVVWYLPKVPIAGVLLVKDAVRFASWLFDWFRARREERRPGDEGPDLADLPHISRAEFLRRVGWTAAGIPFAIVGYGAFRGLYDFQVRHVRVPISGLPRALDGLRIAQLSDIHAGSLFSEQPIEEVARLVNAQRADLVALTGDFVNNDHRELPTVLPSLARLEAPLGIYGVRGNHDHYAHVGKVTETLRAAGVKMLVNDAHLIDIDGARLHIVGTDNTGFRQTFGDLQRALSAVSRNGDDALILLAHDPSFWDSDVRPHGPEIDLTLSGHTHGGQIGFELGPFRWSLARIAYERWAGLYVEDGPVKRQLLYVNRGVGTVGPPLRIGMRPEITILTLMRAA